MNHIHKFAVLALLGFGFVVAGCDMHKQERARVSTEIEQVSADVARIEARRQEKSSQISDAIKSIADLQRGQTTARTRKMKLKDELLSYVLDHKAASAALLAAGGGAASVLSDNMDDDARNVLAVVGIIGAAYCIDEAAECADVASRVAATGARVKAVDDTLSSIPSAIEQAHSERSGLEQAVASLDLQLAERKAKVETLKRRYDELK